MDLLYGIAPLQILHGSCMDRCSTSFYLAAALWPGGWLVRQGTLHAERCAGASCIWPRITRHLSNTQEANTHRHASTPDMWWVYPVGIVLSTL